jgi:hypothetical protein
MSSVLASILTRLAERVKIKAKEDFRQLCVLRHSEKNDGGRDSRREHGFIDPGFVILYVHYNKDDAN